MKRRLTGLIIGIAAFALSAVSVQAGEINANEQSLISAVSQSFSYNGATYVVKSSYIAQGQAKLAQDGADLSAAQAQGYISQFHGSYQELVQEGYCDLISEAPASGNDTATPEPEHSKKEEAKNKLLLKTILGKPGTKSDDSKSDKTETQQMDAQTATATPAADQSSTGVNNWGKEEDLGNSIGFEDVDREQAKQGKVTISGNGSAFTVQNNNTDSKDDNSKAQDVKDNFLSKIVHISLWKILFWVISGISVAAIAAVVYYIVMIKRQHKKNRRLRGIIAAGVGVSAGGWTLLLLVALGLYFGAYNNNSIQRQLMESDYFLGVTQMIRETAQGQLEEAGYDGKIASEVYTLSSVYIEEKQYISKVLAGENDAAVSTDGIENALKTEVTGKSDESNQQMIETLKDTYENMLQFKLGRVIYESRTSFLGWFYLTCIVSIIMLLVFFILACRLYGYPHKAARIMCISILISSCLVAGGAVLAKLLKVTAKIEATPVYYLQFLQKYAAWSINVLMYMGCLGILVAIALMIWKRYLHTIYAE